MTAKIHSLFLLGILILLIGLSACQHVAEAATLPSADAAATSTAIQTSVPTSTETPSPTVTPTPTITLVPTPTFMQGVDYSQALGKDPQSFDEEQLGDLPIAPDPKTQPDENAAWKRGYLATINEQLKTYSGSYIAPEDGRGIGFNKLCYEFKNQNMQVFASYKIPFEGGLWAVVKTYPVKDSQGLVSTFSMIFTPDPIFHVNGRVNNFHIPETFPGFRVFFARDDAMTTYDPSSATYLPQNGGTNPLKSFFDDKVIPPGLETQVLLAAGAD